MFDPITNLWVVVVHITTLLSHADQNEDVFGLSLIDTLQGHAKHSAMSGGSGKLSFGPNDPPTGAWIFAVRKTAEQLGWLWSSRHLLDFK